MADDIKTGDQVPVIRCEARGHVVRLVALPADDQGQAYQQFRHKCPKCGAVQDVQLSDIRVGTAHRKQ
jgi:hypothetical protein